MASEETPKEEADTKEPETVTATEENAAPAEHSPKMSAFVVGYTGEVGKELVKELAKRNIFQKVLLLGRRKVEYSDETISNNSAIEQVVVNFDELEKSKDAFQGMDVGFCCLGTTKGKAGKQGQWKVDHDYAVKSAELAKAGGCKQFHLVSSMGANSGSMIFYNRLKGQTENDVAAFEFEKTSIYRPAMLMCKREEFRMGEWIARKVAVPVDYLFPGVISNGTDIVAKAMVNNVAKTTDEKTEFLEPKTIHKLGTEKV